VSEPTNFNPLAIRRALGIASWRPPAPHGSDGWSFVSRDRMSSIVVSCAPYGDAEWVHASIANRDSLPTYDDLKMLHRAVFGDGWAYQVFSPPSDHVNIHNFALHLWGRLDGAMALPDFTYGSGSV
jgi:hypothetical protein